MTPEFAIVLLLCAGDNCDLVRPELNTTYSTYEACSAAAARSAEKLSEIAAQYREKGRGGELLCLRELSRIEEVEQTYEAIAPTVLRQLPSAMSPRIGELERGSKARVTGLVAGTDWVRIAISESKNGYAYSDGLRRLPPDKSTLAAASNQQTSTSGQAPDDLHKPSPPPAAEQTAAARFPPPQPGAPSRPGEFRDCEHCPAMVPLSGGNYEMGSNADASERPLHRVAIAPFAIGKYEVTESEWGACVAAGSCAYKPRQSAQSERTPMTNLAWDDAIQYTRWLSGLTGKPYRLPAEAEWEYAARAGSSTKYYWGDEIGIAKAHCRGCGSPYDAHAPSPIGSFAANAWGLFDMLGGVAEWTEDCWHSSYKGAPANGIAWHGTPCAAHVLRGGSWMNPPSDLTVSSRNYYDASVRYIANGMRVALSLK